MVESGRLTWLQAREGCKESEHSQAGRLVAGRQAQQPCVALHALNRRVLCAQNCRLAFGARNFKAVGVVLQRAVLVLAGVMVAGFVQLLQVAVQVQGQEQAVLDPGRLLQQLK